MKEVVKVVEKLELEVVRRHALAETIVLERARMRVEHKRPQDWQKLDTLMQDLVEADPFLKARILAKGARVEGGELWVPDAKSFLHVDDPEEVLNQITNAGRDFLHLQGYGTTGLGSNGLNYIALTNNAITPGPTDTTLAGEITTNGLARTQGAYAHTAGTNTTTISNTFTATGSQSCQAAALFTASSGGTMNHELTFTQRSLISGDTLAVTYTITLG